MRRYLSSPSFRGDSFHVSQSVEFHINVVFFHRRPDEANQKRSTILRCIGTSAPLTRWPSSAREKPLHLTAAGIAGKIIIRQLIVAPISRHALL
jgi:hypothetical protein